MHPACVRIIQKKQQHPISQHPLLYLFTMVLLSTPPQLRIYDMRGLFLLVMLLFGQCIDTFGDLILRETANIGGATKGNVGRVNLKIEDGTSNAAFAGVKTIDETETIADSTTLTKVKSSILHEDNGEDLSQVKVDADPVRLLGHESANPKMVTDTTFATETADEAKSIAAAPRTLNKVEGSVNKKENEGKEVIAHRDDTPTNTIAESAASPRALTEVEEGVTHGDDKGDLSHDNVSDVLGHQTYRLRGGHEYTKAAATTTPRHLLRTDNDVDMSLLDLETTEDVCGSLNCTCTCQPKSGQTYYDVCRRRPFLNQGTCDAGKNSLSLFFFSFSL